MLVVFVVFFILFRRTQASVNTKKLQYEQAAFGFVASLHGTVVTPTSRV